jgi:predicted DNA-binding transcriptional regulator YafY
VRGRAIENIFQHDAYAQLNARQKQTLDVMRERGEVTVNDLRSVLGVTISARQILRDLNLLVDMGLIVIVGRSRNTRYRIASGPRMTTFEP